MGDIIQDSMWNKSYVSLDYIELRTRLNQFGIFVSKFDTEKNIENYLFEENNGVLNGKHCWSKTMVK